MKIAIAAPCPVPFMVGGAERLWWGLASYFNEETPHPTEVIKLPAPEGDLVSVVRSYEHFAMLDLRSFDLLISGKYPAWMVEHPNHVCYMLHRLRGLYECYFGEPALSVEDARHPAVASLRAFMARYPQARSALPEFFGRWNEAVASRQLPDAALAFPGPLAREIVRWLDDIGLSRSAIRRYAAISQAVAGRDGYFPTGVEVAVAHPPPHRSMDAGDRFDHFYTVSRFDHIKRVGLVVQAMRRVNTDVPLIVGGAGPEEARIRELAEGDPRIRFAGFQNDSQVRENYRNALAVPFVPWQEDYGLIAVEAMQCAKPVITMADSGGPCELVEDGVSGVVCEPTVEGLAAAMQRFADDPGLARTMGRAALERGRSITWARVASTLLDNVARDSARPSSGRKLVVASTFTIFPPRHGGQVRSYQIYRALAPEFETVIVSACAAEESAGDREIAPGVREVRVPLSAAHQRLEREMHERMGTPVTDVMMTRLHRLTPALGEAIRRESSGACAAVASHPYLYPLLRETGLPVWYEAQDFELDLKRKLFDPLPGGDDLVRTVEEVDRACAAAAEIILCVSPEDGLRFVDEFGVPPDRIVPLPNGTDTGRIPFAGRDERAALKTRMGLAGLPLALFMGSGHWPNIEAVRRIFEFAAELPHVAFAIVGSVCYAFDPKLKPDNVLFLGEVDDVTRNLCLHAADMALNPMEHGSGTNIKMLDYFAAGLPVVTTGRGARGLELDDGAYALVREVGDFPAAITEMLEDGLECASRRAHKARTMVEARYDWHAMVTALKPRLVALAEAGAVAGGRDAAQLRTAAR
jgi:glycosyltransferase involved in cell wall biosynthesis